MRTPDQVVAEIEKAEKALTDAADNLKRLQTELSDMCKFVSENVAKFTPTAVVTQLRPAGQPRTKATATA